MKFKKIAIIISIILTSIIIFTVLDRKFKWFGYNDNVIKSNENCVKIECTHLNKNKIDAVLESNDDINNCLEALSKMKLRKRDFIDVILDPFTYTGGYMGATKYYITIIYENGNEDVVSFYFNVNVDISWLDYNGVKYMVKGKTPELIHDLFFGNN